MATIFDDLDTRKQSKGGGTVFDDLPTSPAHPATPSAAAQEAPGAQTMPQAGMAAPMPLQPASEPPAGSTPQPIASHKSVQTQSGDAPKDESRNIFKNPAGASKESIKEQYQSSAKLLSDNLQAALQPGLSPVTQSARAQAIMGALGVLTAPLAPGFGLLENAGRTVALAFLKRVAQGDVYKKMVEKGWIDPKSDKVNLQNIGVLSGPDRPSTGNVAIDLLADIVTPLPPVLKGARAVKGLVKAADKTADVAKVADKTADVAKAADNAPAATVFDDLVTPEAKPPVAAKPAEVAAPAPEATVKPVEAPVPEPIKAMELEPVKSPEAAPTQEIRYRTDYRDYRDGQHDGTVYAYDENGVVQGKLDFSIYQGRPKIHWVEVADDQRRKGIGRELVNQLQKEVPEAKIEWGMTTPEGTALRKAIEGDAPAAKPSKKAASAAVPAQSTGPTIVGPVPDRFKPIDVDIRTRKPVEAPKPPEPIPAKEPEVDKPVEAPAANAPEPETPTLITRWDGSSIDDNKPHGVYFTLGGKSPHDDIGSTLHTGEATPKNPLTLEAQTAYSERFRGVTHNSEGPTSAGIAALKALSTPEEFNRLIRASKADLVKELEAKFPGYDYAKYFDSHELREAYGAHLARQKGYDAIVYPDKENPNFSEYVALTPDAYRIKPQQAEAATPAAAPKPATVFDEIATKEPEATASPAVEPTAPPAAKPAKPANLAIRPGEYRNKQGFFITGRNAKGSNVRIFTESRDSAERIREKLKRGEDTTVEDFLPVKEQETARKSPQIDAYHEKPSFDPKTGEEGVLRSEWRVVKVTPEYYPTIRKHFGEKTVPEPYVLEHRYIRRGVDEGWQPFDMAKSREEALRYIDGGATPVSPGMKKLQEVREAERIAEQEREAKKLEELNKASIERQIRDNSEAAFRRMAESPNPRFRQVAKDWIAAIERLQKDAKFVERAHDDAQFRAEYDAVLKTTKVPEKAKAMREFLAKLPQYEKRFKGKAKATNVPDEVLKDYPELRPKAPEAAVSTQKAPKIEAYSETERPDPETGEPGTLRKEWRVRITGKKAALKIREEFSYPPGKFYLESRYIKNGKEEPWKIVTTDDNYDSLVASIDSNATPVTKRMQGVQEKWRKRRTESEKREAAKKANEEKAREEKQIRDNSEAAFRRMAESPNPRFRQVAKDWIAAIERLQKDTKFVERAHDDAQFRAEYDAVLKTTKVPEKAKAMRAFLAKLPQYEKRFKGKAKATKAERPAMAGSVGSHVSSRIPPQLPPKTGPAPKPVRQTTQSVAAPPGSALAEAEQITSVEPKRPSALQKVRALPKALQTSLTSEFTPLRQLERNVLEVAGEPVPQVDLARKFEQVAGAPAQAQADVIDFRRAVVDPIRDIADDFNTYLFLKRTASRLRDNPDVKKVGDWTVEKAEEALAQMRGKLGEDDMARLEAAGEAYQIEMDKALRLQVETGRMTQEMYDKIKASNDFYARFKVMKYMEGVDGAPSGTGRNIANTQDLTKAITGIEEEDLAIGNILQASAEQIVRSRILAEKNRKMLELDALLEFDADGTFIKRAQPTRYYRIETDTAGELLHQLGMQETSRNPQLLEQSLVKVGKAIEFAEQVGLKVNRRKMQSLGRGTIGGVEGGGRISLNAFTSDTMAHELGHTFDTILRDMNGDPVIKTRKVFGVERDIPQRISSEINAAKRIDPKTGKPAFGGQNEFQKELAALVDFTGLGGGPKYRSSAKERFAEFISLYIHDPKKAKELAPTWTAHFEREILPRNQIKSLVDRLADFYRKVDKLPNIKTRLKELDDNDYLTLAIRKAFPERAPQIGVRFGTKPQPGNEIVTYFKNGKETALEVSKEVAEAIQGANAAQTGLIAKAMAITKTPLQWGATGANAAFQVRNLLFADLPRTALMSRYGIRDIADIYRFPADWAYSFFTSLKGNFGKENDLYMAWLRSGAANSTIQRALTPTAFKATLGLPEPMTADRLTRIPKEAILDTIAKFSSAIEETSKIVGLKRGMRFENITTDMHPDIIRRRMEYVVSEVRNYSGSPDFLRRGRDGQNLNLLFMFFNARVQGNIADIQRLAGKTGKAEARAAWARIGAAIGVPATLLSIVNHSGEYAEHYQGIPRWERDNYFMIPNGKWFVNEDGENVPDYWRIPKREITKLFGNMIDSAVEFAAKADPEALGRFAASALENISPVNIEGETGLERLESVVSSLNPIIKTPVELASGRDTFRHYDVTPQYMEGAPTEEQYRYSTPKPFVAAGQSELAKALGLSPLHLEMLTRSVTAGGLTQFTARKPEIGRGALAANPITRMFYRSGRLNNEAAEQAATKAEQKETAEQVKRRREAERMVREWQENGTGDEQKRKAIAELRRSDPKLAEKVRDLENARAKGIDNWDRRIATLGVESGARAEYIVEILKSLKSKEERDKYLAELRRKKLLTPKVYGQVRRQMQKM